jgi:hypothetical protein
MERQIHKVRYSCEVLVGRLISVILSGDKLLQREHVILATVAK